jgi:uncharacterized membrane protein HdeD (DUF308 family)
MTEPISASVRDTALAGGLAKRATGLSIFLSVVLIVLGMLAILLPVEMSLGVVIVVCWLLMIGAVVHVIDAFKGSGVWHTIWQITVAVIYFLTGLYLRFNLGIGLVTLTLALIVFFVVQGLADIFIYLRVRKSIPSGSLLLHGIVTLILGLMIWMHWPSSALWVVGTLVGINMIMTGTTRLMLTLAVRKVMKSVPQTAV